MKIVPFISGSKISKTVKDLARELRHDYKGKRPILIGCLTGGFVFMADLVREMGIPLECDFMKVSSYGEKMTAGKVELLLDNTLPVKGRHVLVVEDIVDTGATLPFICKRLSRKGPKSLKTCVLLYKESPRATVRKEAIDYLGITIPDKFVVGYGIDCAQRFRELKYIAKVGN